MGKKNLRRKFLSQQVNSLPSIVICHVGNLPDHMIYRCQLPSYGRILRSFSILKSSFSFLSYLSFLFSDLTVLREKGKSEREEMCEREDAAERKLTLGVISRT